VNFLVAPQVRAVYERRRMNFDIPEETFDGLIFDCDGTLADNMPLHHRAWSEALERFGAHFPVELFYQLGGVPARGTVEELNRRFGWSLDPEAVAEQKEAVFMHLVEHTEPIEAVVELVARFRGKKRMAVASGGRRQIVSRTLQVLGLSEAFDAIVTTEDYARGKPAPDPFLEAARRIGVEPARCVVLEDTPTGAAAAEAAGMRYRLVPSRHVPGA
jgi:HAD superfamily hydrolase (TIGR01509 family)